MRYFLVLLSMVAFSQMAKGQTTRKETLNAEFWNSYELDISDGEHHVVFSQIQGRFGYLGNSFAQTGLFQRLNRVQALVGYENVNEHWNFGGIVRTAFYKETTDLHFRPYLTHKSAIGKFALSQTLSVAYIAKGASDNPNVVVNDLGRLSFTLGLDRAFDLKNKPLELRLSYRFFFLKQLGSSVSDIYSGRYVDKDRLMFEASFSPVDRLKVDAFIMKDVNRFLNSAVTPNENFNNITPVIGAGVTLLLPAKKDAEGTIKHRFLHQL